ncbi:phage tail tape measure protein [Cryobacterium aureum]|uniref:phage tail tape measure protein n=1 Tax=Cryobacterium aureum TaxID=995037 RepID=UPI000CF515CA|nr:phage tail tape measure protein [Cryobacterium aureum]
MFNAGAISFALQMMGAEVFQQDAKAADKALAGLGTTAESTAKKVSPLGTEVDKTGTAAKNAKSPLDDAGKSTKAVGDESEKASKKVAPLATDIDKTGKASKAAKAPVDEAGKSTKKLGDENATAAPKVKQTAAELEALKVKSDQAGRMVGTVALGIGTAFAAMATVAVAKFADFDQAVSQVGAATMASGEDLDALSASAVQAGVDTVFTATKAANAQTELAKAGVSVKDILGGSLVGSLALASAGELEVARAAEIAATTLTVFNLKGTQTMHVADLLAAGAGKAQGSVDDLALALEYVGPTFARLKIPLEDTVGTLAMLAANGILGEKAGTGLRGVMQSLTAPTKTAAATMAEYGINVFDAQGNFTTMEDAAGQLQKGLGDLDEQTRSAALGAIFGAESANVAGILYAKGSEGVAEWTANVNDSGFAAEQARMKLDNLAGDIEMLGGSMDAAFIKSGSASNDVMRDMVQILTGVVDWYSNLDDGLQGSVFWLGVGTAAALLLGGTFLLAVPKVVEFRAAMTLLNTTMKGTALAGGIVGIALTAAAVILGAFATNSANAANDARGLSDTLDAQTGAINENTRAWVADKLQKDGSITSAKEMGMAADDLVDAYLQQPAALAKVRKAVEDLHDPNSKLAKELAENGVTALEMRGGADDLWKVLNDGEPATEDASRRFAELKEATDAGTGSTEAATAATEAQTAATEAAAKANQDHLDDIAATDAAFVDLGGAYDTVIAKNQATAQATADATESSSDSWEDYYDGFSVGLDDYLAELQTMVDNQNNWESNMVTLAGKVSEGTLEELRKLGPEGAPLVADLVNGSAEQLALAETLFAEKAGNATGAFAARLTDSKTVIDAASAQLGTDAANEIATKLAAGTSTVEQIILDYGLKIEGLSPEVQISTDAALSKVQALSDRIAGIDMRAIMPDTNGAASGNGQMGSYANGAVVSFHAQGSVSERHVAQIERAGAIRVWAEPETGGEAYIPLTPSKRGRSMAILADVAERFGQRLVPNDAQSFANGSTPAARSTRERPPVRDQTINVYEAVSARATAMEVARQQNRLGV